MFKRKGRNNLTVANSISQEEVIRVISKRLEDIKVKRERFDALKPEFNKDSQIPVQ